MILLIFAAVVVVNGQQCTPRNFLSSSHVVGCVPYGCCEDDHQVSSYCSSLEVCCLSRDLCNGTYTCSREQQTLACELYRSDNVTSIREQVNGFIDHAMPSTNLRDMCYSHLAYRSSYSYACEGSCRPPQGRICLSTGLLKYLVELKNHGKIMMTALAGGCHSCTSRHYSGLAVDLQKDARAGEYLSTCTAMGGWGQDEGDHIHCQFYDQPHPNGF